MHSPRARHILSVATLTCAAIASGILSLPLAAQTTSAAAAQRAQQTGMPAGILFVYDANGGLRGSSGERSVDLRPGNQFPLDEALSVQLAEGSTIALAFSNGIGLWVQGPADFTIDSFSQQPFNSNPRQRTEEQTRSQLGMTLNQGQFVFASPHLSALSAVRLNFGNQNRLEAEASDAFILNLGSGENAQDVITVLNGRTLLYQRAQASSLLVGTGQRIQLPRNPRGNEIALPQSLTTEQRMHSEQIIQRPQQINQRVWFHSKEDSPARAEVILPTNFWLAKPANATRIQ